MRNAGWLSGEEETRSHHFLERLWSQAFFLALKAWRQEAQLQGFHPRGTHCS